MANNIYHKGDRIKIEGTWTNAAGTAIDPASVFATFTDPSGNTTTYEYGTDAELIKDSTGVYHFELDLDESGTWPYRLYSTGSGQAAINSHLIVESY